MYAYDKSLRMNTKNISAFLFFILISLSSYFLYKYQEVKKENLVLQLKLKAMAKNKKSSVSWKEVGSISTQKKIINEDNNAKNEINNNKSIKDEALVDIRDLATEQLMNDLEKDLKRHWKLTEKKLNRNLEIVDELLTRNPNVYSYYKAKLILLLSKENLENSYDPSVDDVLVSMSEFDLTTDKTLKREAFLIAQSNDKADELFSEVLNLEDQLELETNEEDILDLRAQIALKTSQLDTIEDELESGLLDDSDYLNEDLIEIPFLRSLSKGDYDAVIENAESLVSEFPNSVSGHYYLIKALELSGEDLAALEYIEELELSETKINMLKERLRKSKNIDPGEYLKKIRFQ